MTLTWRSLALMALAATTALVWPWQVAVMLMIGVGAVSLGDALVVRALPKIERSFPEILSRGIETRFMASRSEHGARTAMHQAMPPDIMLRPRRALASPLTGSLVALRRGVHEIGPLATRTLGPLGLGGWYHRVGEPTTITVFPDMHTARWLAMAVRTGRFRDEGRRARGPLGLGTDFESIREYHQDDDIRQLNVRATARMGTPMTNRYRIEQDRDVILVIDCGRTMRAPIGDRTRLDAAIDAAAAIAAVADEVGDRVGVVAYRDRLLRNVRPARDNGLTVASAIYDLEPEPVDSDHRLALEIVTRMKRAFVLVLTDLMDESAVVPLFELSRTVGRTHAMCIAGVTDDEIQRSMATPATKPIDAFQTAVSADLVAETRRIVAELTGRGATVVEAPLHEFSHRCVAAYLDAKRRARI